MPKLFLGLGILEAAPGEVTGAGEAGPGADLCMMLRLGLGASGGRGLVPVNSIPGGELASLCSPGTEVMEEVIMEEGIMGIMEEGIIIIMGIMVLELLCMGQHHTPCMGQHHI